MEYNESQEKYQKKIGPVVRNMAVTCKTYMFPKKTTVSDSLSFAFKKFF